MNKSESFDIFQRDQNYELLLTDSSLHSPVLRDSYQQLIVTCPRPFGPIKELIIENVDIETVWEQLQFHNRPHNRYLRKAIGLLFKRITDRIQKEIDQENAQKSKKIKLVSNSSCGARSKSSFLVGCDCSWHLLYHG